MKMKTKKFDCVEMMHRCGRKIHDELDGLTIEEQIDYWRQRNQALRKEHARLKVKVEEEKPWDIRERTLEYGVRAVRRKSLERK